MRSVFVLLAGLLLLTACENEDNYNYNGGRGNGGYGGYGGNSGNYYGGGDDRYGYGSYYPYGQRNYPRDRIFMIDNNHRCTQGRIYQGYCYHRDDDYRRAVEWDRSHGYDNNWHNKRKEWCNSHDCRRDHAIRDDEGNWDKNHKERPVERDRQAQPYPPRHQDESPHPYQNPNGYDKRKPGRNDGYHREPADDVRNTRPPVQQDSRQQENRQRDRERTHQAPGVNTEAPPTNTRYHQSPGRNQSSPDTGQQEQRNNGSGNRSKNESSSSSGSNDNNGKRSRNKRGGDAQPGEATPDGQ
jgi:hypothetical protein